MSFYCIEINRLYVSHHWHSRTIESIFRAAFHPIIMRVSTTFGFQKNFLRGNQRRVNLWYGNCTHVKVSVSIVSVKSTISSKSKSKLTFIEIPLQLPSRKAFEHWKLKCTLNKLLKELDIYSDIDLVVFEGNNNTMLHHNGAGILTYRNGAVFNGSFADGLKDGFGRYRCLFVTFVFCFILFHLTYYSLLPKVFLRVDTSKDIFRMTS